MLQTLRKCGPPPQVHHKSLGANAYNLGNGKEGFYGTTITGLTAGQTYYYRIRSQGVLNPKGISGSSLQLWLDADDSSTITHSSNAIIQWQDKSGNGNHATKQPHQECRLTLYPIHY